LDPNLVFVLMEFGAPYTKIYNALIKPTVVEEGFQCIKSDDIYHTSAVIEDIWENINEAALVKPRSPPTTRTSCTSLGSATRSAKK